MSAAHIVKRDRELGEIGLLSARFEAFNNLRDDAENGEWSEWINTKSKKVTREKLVLFVGKSGYGKSSTINAIAGVDILKTSDVAACTKECQCLCFRIHGNCWLSLGDLPGIGESIDMDEKYIRMYEDFLSHASAIVHVIRADARDFSIDEIASKRLYNSVEMRSRVIYALGQCDKIEPIDRTHRSEPTKQQKLKIDEKVGETIRIFSPHNKIVPYSAQTGWNLNALADEIVRVIIGQPSEDSISALKAELMCL